MTSDPGPDVRPARPPALLFGIPIDDLTMDETVELLGEFVRRGRADGRGHQLATVNVDFLVNALGDRSITEILQRADACLADGMPIVWGSSLLGMPLAERVAGSDLVPRLFDESQRTGWRVHVFGSSPDVAARARELIAERYPDARVSIDPGPMITDVAEIGDEVLDSIAEVDPDILCVALGNPKQELFIRAHRDRLRVPVMIGVGGSVDMLVGERRRAPGWVQRVGLEWVARAVQEPKRLGRRYAHDIRVMVPRFASEWRAHRRRRRHGGLSIAIGPDEVDVEPTGPPQPDDGAYAAAASAIAHGASLRIHAVDGPALPDPAAARLVGLVGLARRADRPVIWEGDPAAVRLRVEQLGIAPSMLACSEQWRPEHPA
ncbi:MAG: WecB/TagA/CpsF family glycosyltransferase [Ilumatobacter sp.]|uniref:WecB/TagA/CpsF family glycosyltransferase n=1 Tax=Ilumatobacter sp. TaxID=1967498 RepID=UPI002613D257|nr:WecB/TagA/CpsF family glycosyltransferase [Ilumatobacter sp.]MDJ0770837.1 WecB/TagA/CpsF family glycosyltransferase [Ilumatobacter sp.]